MALTSKQKQELAGDLAAGRRMNDIIRFRGLDRAQVQQWQEDNPQAAQKAFFQGREGNGSKVERLTKLQAIKARIETNLAAVTERIAEVEAE